MPIVSMFLNPKTVRALGTSRALRGLRTGNQSVLIGGLALAIIGWARGRSANQPDRELLVRKVVPLGSTLIVRHAPDGSIEPRIEVREPDIT